MPNKPSARGLVNRVDIYKYAPVQDPDAGTAPGPYGAALATAVPCSVQPGDPIRFFDERIGRIVEKRTYDVLLITDYGLTLNDKLVWTDGGNRTLIVMGTANQAGKGAAYFVSTQEPV